MQQEPKKSATSPLPDELLENRRRDKTQILADLFVKFLKHDEVYQGHTTYHYTDAITFTLDGSITVTGEELALIEKINAS